MAAAKVRDRGIGLRPRLYAGSVWAAIYAAIVALYI